MGCSYENRQTGRRTPASAGAIDVESWQTWSLACTAAKQQGICGNPGPGLRGLACHRRNTTKRRNEFERLLRRLKPGSMPAARSASGRTFSAYLQRFDFVEQIERERNTRWVDLKIASQVGSGAHASQ